MLRSERHAIRIGDNDFFKMLTVKITERRCLGGPRHKREDNIKVDLQEIGVNTKILIGSMQGLNYLRNLCVCVCVCVCVYLFVYLFIYILLVTPTSDNQ